MKKCINNKLTNSILYFYRLHNKGVYVKVSLQKMVGRGMNKDLRKTINLEVDGKHIDLPNIKGIIILNIMR